MELNKNDAAVCSIDAQASTASVAEIDLYDELIIFTDLPLEAQPRLDKPSAETKERSPDNADDPPPEPVLTHAPIEAEAAVVQSDAPTTEEPESHSTHEQRLPSYPIEPDEPETVAGESGRTFTQEADELSEPALIAPQIEPDESEPEVETQIAAAVATEEADEQSEPVLIAAQIEPDESEPEVETQTALGVPTEADTTAGFVVTPAPIKPVESVTIVSAAQPASDFDVSKASVETGGNPIPRVSGPRPSGPLSGFNLPPEIVYTGALSRGVCLACGSESGADDLFCLTCGVFIDEIASTLPSIPTCGECKHRIEADEIFCPWCGSAVPA